MPRLEPKGMIRCQVCGEPVAPMWANHDDPPDPTVFVVRCFACAATEEAEGILNDAGPYEGNDGITPEHRR